MPPEINKLKAQDDGGEEEAKIAEEAAAAAVAIHLGLKETGVIQNGDDNHRRFKQLPIREVPEGGDDSKFSMVATTRMQSPYSLYASVAALAFCMLTHSYLLISVFPYSGYLAIYLLNGNTNDSNNNDTIVTKDTAGTYAGWMAAAFMMGRACTSYLWGQAADRYGRTTVLVVSLGLSSLLSIAFGFATTYRTALAIRFAMGACNGIMSSIKTIVSEMAPRAANILATAAAASATATPSTTDTAGTTTTSTSATTIRTTTIAKSSSLSDCTAATSATSTITATKQEIEQWEQRAMGLVIGLWGWGFLFSPGLSGALAEPLQQYPSLSPWLQQQSGTLWLYHLLNDHPFVLPNLMAVLFCLIGIIAIRWCVDETMPHPNSVWHDLHRRVLLCIQVTTGWLRHCQLCWRQYNHQQQSDRGGGASAAVSYQKAIISKEHTSFAFELDDDDNVCDHPHPRKKQQQEGEKQHPTTFGIDAASTAQTNATINNSADDDTSSSSSFLAIWSRPLTRKSLLIYWTYSFISLTVDETFPLFCLSEKAGFGLSELEIGKILSLCGLIFAIGQYGANEVVYRRFGLLGSIRIGCTLAAPALFLMPLSKLINNNSSNNNIAGFEEHQSISRVTFIFLSCVMALYRLFALIFFTNVSVLINRSVPQSQRGTVNGISVLGGSAAKAIGPVFAGFLVTWSVALFDSAGGVAIFGTIGFFGVCLSAVTCCLVQDDNQNDEGDKNKHRKQQLQESCGEHKGRSYNKCNYENDPESINENRGLVRFDVSQEEKATGGMVTFLSSKKVLAYCQ